METNKNSDTPTPPETGQEAAPRPKRNWRKWWKIFKWLFATGTVLGVFVLIFIGVYIVRATRDLPTLEALQEYSPAVMTRVHAGDGKLIAEFGIEKRVFVPIESIPKRIQYALVASEDQRFYEHDGFDLKGFTRAMVANVGHLLKKERFEGGSTLTQQVAKHFLVGSERKLQRKIREVFIAKRIEKAISKDEILELYLNDVFFGRRAYGIAGASLNYFNKPLDDLSLGQMAYLAGLVKGPNNYQPDKNMDKALRRRNYVLTRMVEDGYITQAEGEEAKREDLVLKDRLFGDEYLAAEYFVSEVRKQINGLYGEKQLNEGGLSIRTTLDTKMQLAARKALRRGLEMYDRRHGYRGPLAVMENLDNWAEALVEFPMPKDVAPWQVAVVLSVDKKQAELGFADGDKGQLSLEDIDWAKKAFANGVVGDDVKSVADVIQLNDIILVEKKPVKTSRNKKAKESVAAYNLRQLPEVNGGIIAMDPHTGRVLALVGGYSFTQSQFNRVTQAYRQPGSAFKPFVYAAAIDNGYTPVSQILDAPFVIEHNDRDAACAVQESRGLAALNFGNTDEDGQETPPPDAVPSEITDLQSLPKEEEECGPIFYKPANFNAGRFYGLSTLRLGLEKSRNAMTVRLANDIGMTPIGQYGRQFGVYDETKPELAWALGAGETTLMRLAAAYAGFVNGGKRVIPTLLDRVQDNKGKTIYIHDKRACPECKMDEWTFSAPPELPDEREEVLSPVTAYQMVSMLEGVVQRGTGRQMLRLERPIAGKTGTTNDFKDAWFMGFSPDLVAGVYVGHDTPQSLGTETGAKAAGPIFRFFMGDVLKDKPKVSFRIPEGVLLAPVDQVTGEPSYIGAPGFIYEAFKPGTEPRLGQVRSKISIGDIGVQDDGVNFGFGRQDEDTVADITQTNPDGVQGDAPQKDTLTVATKPKEEAPKDEDEVDLDDGLY
jgi:penicillin-binding protein 1A